MRYCKVCGKELIIETIGLDFYSNKLCSDECKKKFNIRNCRCCNKEFCPALKSRRFCDECNKDKKIFTRLKYNNNLKEKECEKCHNKFQAKSNQKFCFGCRKEIIYQHKFNRIKQTIKCKVCNLDIGEIEIFRTKRSKDVIYRICNKCKIVKRFITIKCQVCKKEIEIKEDSRLYSSQTKLNNYTIFRECSECKQKRRQILIDKLTEINIERKEKGIVVPFKIPQHLRDKARQRMLLNNPMFSPDIRKKASDTIQERIKSGELIYKKGKEHHLFDKRCKHKLYYVARSRLYQFWTKPVMQRDGFKCKLCGISGRLQVHHLIPFIQIFNSILEENGITTECANNLLNENYEKFEQLVSKIVSRHKLEDGITVCKNCHIDIDNHYRVKKEKTRTFLYENKKDYRSYI